jgi:hypothetical protein
VVQAPEAVQAAHPTSHEAQVASPFALHAAVWYLPAPQAVQAPHTMPSPVNPGLHAQVKSPAVFWQTASLEQLSVCRSHSSMSTHPDAPPPV